MCVVWCQRKGFVVNAVLSDESQTKRFFTERYLLKLGHLGTLNNSEQVVWVEN